MRRMGDGESWLGRGRWAVFGEEGLSQRAWDWARVEGQWAEWQQVVGQRFCVVGRGNNTTHVSGLAVKEPGGAAARQRRGWSFRELQRAHKG